MKVIFQTENKSNNVKRIEQQLEITDDLFIPCLSKRVDIKEYANKLAAAACVIYAVVDSKDCGHCAFYINKEGGYAYITSIAVATECQGKGVADKMLAYVRQICADNFLKEIRLAVHKENAKAFRFYEKEGFAVSGEKEQWYEMVKRLI